MSISPIPPFPSQDLAKLVLGYLAEEQLMTAYDEFLQASPYLDALKNEYDRIFMTSLKNILAEYRAVKIYVESCKPVVLRRRLFGCANLLEVVKFLIQNIDYNKLKLIETSRTRDSSANTSITSASTLSRLTDCDVCNSLKLPSCVCKSNTVTSQTCHVNASSDTSVETTALENLPGNHTQVKQTEVKFEKIANASTISSSKPNAEIVPASNEYLDKRNVSSTDQNAVATVNSDTHVQSTQDVSTPQNIHNEQLINQNRFSNEKIEEFNKILKSVFSGGKNSDSLNITLNNPGNRLSSGAFQEFATGVHGGHNAAAKPTPDSSTSENITHFTPCNGANNKTVPSTENGKPHTKATILLTVATVKNTTQPRDMPNYCPIRPKPTEQKVTILSDIKVDKTYPNEANAKIPPVLKNATSTPLMQMQTILINGTPAFKQDTKNMNLSHYTKDEIMAMPTIILVPSSGQPETSSSQTQPVTQQASMTSEVSSSARLLGPLLIDVSSRNTATKENNPEPLNLPTLDETVHNEKNDSVHNETLVKTVEMKPVEMKNSSMPKDMTEVSRSTPHSQRPIRKSSSTPRRNSHVRVLDFTTPRRILQDTINEHSSEQNSNDAEILVSKSPSVNNFTNEVSVETEKHSVETENHIDNTVNKSKVNSNIADECTSTKENRDINKNSSVKRTNWDADLRALVSAHTENIDQSGETSSKSKPKPKKKEQPSTSGEADKSDKSKRKTKKKPSKNDKSPKVNKKTTRPKKEPVPVTVPVKPTINIVTDWNVPQQEEREESVNKSNEEQIDTPDTERLSLQNAIGAKLNISDLLETPYKQALYDIQMETPRFLGPDIPGEPLSDIKIMNIPTPRFLSSPRNSQPTPSSYSSRPTDYSSGGSYYKPEDQDYLQIDDSEYPESNIENEDQTNMNSKAEEIECQPRKLRTRPVRTCTKNVSYCSSSNNKPKDSLDKDEVSSDTSSRISTSSKTNKEIEKGTKESKPKEKSKPETKKRLKRKTPIKKDNKSFIKMKPRRVTPVKDDGRSKRKLSESQARIRTSSKEKSVNATPAAAFVPTKSRRKSSTPRKLHCTKTFTSESSGHESPEAVKTVKNVKQNKTSVQDSDTEHLALRWSDDGSQDTKTQDKKNKNPKLDSSVTDSDEISKIQEFIAETESKLDFKERESNLHIDLVKRGFDIETAKIIERDLLDMPSTSQSTTVVNSNEVTVPKQFDATLEKMNQSDTSNSLNLHIDESKELSVDDDEEETELSVHESNEDTDNFINCYHDDASDKPTVTMEKFKDNFTMEVCIDDGVAVRLKATPFTVLFEHEPKDLETEMAVKSITNFDRLYTPIKDAARAQCYEIFDSTLTSIDTPLKANSPKRKEREMMVTEIVLEIEKEEYKDNLNDGKKRKRDLSSSSSDENKESKKSKADPQYLLNSASIQNIDIETVLTKLHGP